MDLFYQNIGQRLNDIITYNNFIPLDDLDYSKQYLVFYVHENENSHWATFMDKDDLRVIKIDEDENVTYEENSLTNFLFQICIYELCNCLKYNMMFFAKPDEVKEIVNEWEGFHFTTRRSEDEFPNEFYYKDGAIGFVWYGELGYTFYCGAESVDNLKFMKTFTDTKGLKDDSIHVDMNERLENGYWDFYINEDSCKEKQFWSSI